MLPTQVCSKVVPFKDWNDVVIPEGRENVDYKVKLSKRKSVKKGMTVYDATLTPVITEGEKMSTDRPPFIGLSYFAAVAMECEVLFIDQHYYGCIALCQSLAEAYARFLILRWTGKPTTSKFRANLHKLEANHVQPDVRELLNELFNEEHRNDFHHLNPTIPTQRHQLVELATKEINLLHQVENQIFEFKYTEKGVSFKHPVYWFPELDDPEAIDREMREIAGEEEYNRVMKELRREESA